VKDKDLIEAFEQSEINLLVELRMGKGFDEEEYEKMIKALTACADEWESRTSIPGDVVRTLVELYDELYNFSLIYGGEESARIKKAAENSKKLIQRCTKENGEIEPEKARVIAKLIEKINDNGNFFKKLQDGKGMDEQQFEKIYHELNDNIDEIYSWAEFPKVLVNIFIDLSELDLFVGQYKDEFKQLEEADKIYDAYERIFSLIFG
jgi:esterase/lipase